MILREARSPCNSFSIRKSSTSIRLKTRNFSLPSFHSARSSISFENVFIPHKLQPFITLCPKPSKPLHHRSTYHLRLQQTPPPPLRQRSRPIQKPQHPICHPASPPHMFLRVTRNIFILRPWSKPTLQLFLRDFVTRAYIYLEEIWRLRRRVRLASRQH